MIDLYIAPADTEGRHSTHRRLSVATFKAGQAWNAGAREVRIETEYCRFSVERTKDGVYGALTSTHKGGAEIEPSFRFWKAQAAATGLPVFDKNGWIEPADPAEPLFEFMRRGLNAQTAVDELTKEG